MINNYGNLYRKDHSENIKIFNDLKSEQEFSSISNNLNQLFRDNSYSRFHKNLIQKKTTSNNNFLDLFEKSEMIDKHPIKKISTPFDIKQFESCLIKMKLKNDLLTERIKNPYQQREKFSQYYELKKETNKQKNLKPSKPYFPNVPDVGRYNPSYDILNKHSYQAFFGKENRKCNTIENDSNNNNDINSLSIIIDDKKFNSIKNNKRHVFHISNNSNILSKLTNSPIRKHNFIKKCTTDLHKQKDTSSNNLNTSISSYISKNNNISRNSSMIKNNSKKSLNNVHSSTENDDNNISLTISASKNKNNHCLRFDSYPSRKPLINKIIYDTNIKTELPNYYSPKYLKGFLNFDKKINVASYIDKEISKNNNVPPLGFYEPKYDAILKSTKKNVYFDQKSYSSLPKIKKSKMKKVICDYNVNAYYKVVPALNSIKIDKNIIDNEQWD